MLVGVGAIVSGSNSTDFLIRKVRKLKLELSFSMTQNRVKQ
jgi:hypothetical protein